MATNNQGRNWTRRSIEEIFDSMFEKHGQPGPGPTPIEPGDISGAVSIENLRNAPYSTSFQIIRGFTNTTIGDKTVEDKPFLHSGLRGEPITVTKFHVYDTSQCASSLKSAYWFNSLTFRIGASQLVCIPPTGTDIYYVYVDGSDYFNMNQLFINVTDSYNRSAQIRYMVPNVADLIESALYYAAGFVNSCDILVINPYGSSALLVDDDLLSIANYAVRGVYTNVITVQ